MIQNLEETKRYMEDSIPGVKLRENCRELLLLKTNNPYEVFWPRDDKKLLFCITLFKQADPQCDVFVQVFEAVIMEERT